MGKCSAWKKLTAGQRFTLKTAVGANNIILKDCPLEDAPELITMKSHAG